MNKKEIDGIPIKEGTDNTVDLDEFAKKVKETKDAKTEEEKVEQREPESEVEEEFEDEEII